jgi:hypothetical protein
MSARNSLAWLTRGLALVTSASDQETAGRRDPARRRAGRGAVVPLQGRLESNAPATVRTPGQARGEGLDGRAGVLPAAPSNSTR